MKNDWTLKEVMMPGSVSSFHLMASSVQRQLTKALMSPKRRINDKFNFHFYIMTYSSRGRYVTGVYNVSCVVAGGPGPQPPPPGAAFPPPPPPAHPHPRPHHHPHHQVSTRPLHTHTHTPGLLREHLNSWLSILHGPLPLQYCGSPTKGTLSFLIISISYMFVKFPAIRSVFLMQE